MLSDNTHPRDLCPICLTKKEHARLTYCSTTCRNTGNLFRRRFDLILKDLSALDFKFAWYNGIQLRIELPQALEYMYPDFARNFYFPEPFENFMKLGIDEFFFDMGEQWGTNMANYLRLFAPATFYSPDQKKRNLRTFARFLLKEPETSFQCSECKHRFIKSFAAQDAQVGVCSRCSVNSEDYQKA